MFLCGRSLTWPALHVLAEGLELRLTHSGFLVEDDRTAETLRRLAQTFGLQLLAVLKSKDKKGRVKKK